MGFPQATVARLLFASVYLVLVGCGGGGSEVAASPPPPAGSPTPNPSPAPSGSGEATLVLSEATSDPRLLKATTLSGARAEVLGTRDEFGRNTVVYELAWAEPAEDEVVLKFNPAGDLIGIRSGTTDQIEIDTSVPGNPIAVYSDSGGSILEIDAGTFPQPKSTSGISTGQELSPAATAAQVQPVTVKLVRCGAPASGDVFVDILDINTGIVARRIATRRVGPGEYSASAPRGDSTFNIDFAVRENALDLARALDRSCAGPTYGNERLIGNICATLAQMPAVAPIQSRIKRVASMCNLALNAQKGYCKIKGDSPDTLAVKLASSQREKLTAYSPALGLRATVIAAPTNVVSQTIPLKQNDAYLFDITLGNSCTRLTLKNRSTRSLLSFSINGRSATVLPKDRERTLDISDFAPGSYPITLGGTREGPLSGSPPQYEGWCFATKIDGSGRFTNRPFYWTSDTISPNYTGATRLCFANYADQPYRENDIGPLVTVP